MGEFDQTIGFTLMGVLVNTFLTGVIMSQFTTYWTAKYHDPWWTKAVVGVLFAINITQEAAVLYMAWFYCVTNFNNPSVVATSLWPYPLTALSTAIIALINQTFQSWRIYIFTQSKLLFGFLLVTALAACGMGIAAAIESWIFSELAKLVALQPVVEGNLALQSSLDVIISIILSYTFSQSKTSFSSTDKVLNRLIRGAVQSGVFTSIFALGTLLSFRLSPATYMIALFALPIGRIYTHTMMDHLVSREELRNILSSGHSGSRNNNIISVPYFSTGERSAPVDTIVMVDTATHVTKDGAAY